VEQEELADILTTVREFIRDEVVPLEPTIEEDDEIPERLRQACKEMGLYGFAIPEQYGGIGLTMAQEAELVFELGYTTPALRSLFGTNNGIAGHVLLEGGTEEQRDT
jgi:acyl-CoA dehydrogenase